MASTILCTPRQRSLVLRAPGPYELNLDSPRASGLLVWLVAGQNGLKDLSPFHSPLTYAAGTGAVQDIYGAPGHLGGLGFNLATAGGHIDITSWPIPSVMTVAAWVKAPAGAPSWSVVTEVNRGGADTFGLWKSGNGAFYHWRWSAGGPLGGASDFGTFTASEIVHLVGTFDGATARAYQNGISKLNVAGTRAAPGSGTLTFEGNSNAEGWGAGQIFDLRIYNRAYSDGEVWGLFDARTRWDIIKQPQPIFDLPITLASKVLLTRF